MKIYGKSAVSEFLEDQIVFRSLNPIDPWLPNFELIRREIDLPSNTNPRKTSSAYAQTIVFLLNEARKRDMPNQTLERIILVGDTRMNDAQAFINICREGKWSGLAFIGAENDQAACTEIIEQDGRKIFLSNRWAALDDFNQYCLKSGFHVDERTAILLDLDKTVLGARGRNDRSIDQARLEAARQTVDELLGDNFDFNLFYESYRHFNRPEYHPFTQDNQDYLVYVCLILGSGLYTVNGLQNRILEPEMNTFEYFLESVNRKLNKLPHQLQAVHKDFYQRVLSGDPTPFKTFRRKEYLMTVSRMGCFKEEAPIGQILAEEITITQEVRRMALEWRDQGALLLGLSDKPDEASLPTSELVAQGYQPIHRVLTHIIGD